jgi:hypothetical protein
MMRALSACLVLVLVAALAGCGGCAQPASSARPDARKGCDDRWYLQAPTDY